MSSSPARSPTACTAATWAMLECGSALGKPPLKMQPACITSLSLATGTRCRIGKASKNRASFSFDPTAHPWHDLAKPVGCSESAGEWQEVATRVPRQQPSTGTVPRPSERLGGAEKHPAFPVTVLDQHPACTARATLLPALVLHVEVRDRAGRGTIPFFQRGKTGYVV